jgi:hypothetical protein
MLEELSSSCALLSASPTDFMLSIIESKPSSQCSRYVLRHSHYPSYNQQWRLSWQWPNSNSLGKSPSRRVLLAQCFLSHSRYASTMLCTSRTFTSHHDGLSYCFSHNPLPAATLRMLVATPSRLFVCVCMWCSRPICFPRQRDFGCFTPVRDRYSVVMKKSHCATSQWSAGVCAWRVAPFIAHKASHIKHSTYASVGEILKYPVIQVPRRDVGLS